MTNREILPENGIYFFTPEMKWSICLYGLLNGDLTLGRVPCIFSSHDWSHLSPSSCLVVSDFAPSMQTVAILRSSDNEFSLQLRSGCAINPGSLRISQRFSQSLRLTCLRRKYSLYLCYKVKTGCEGRVKKIVCWL